MQGALVIIGREVTLGGRFNNRYFGLLQLPFCATCKAIAIIGKAHKGGCDTVEIAAAEGGPY